MSWQYVTGGYDWHFKDQIIEEKEGSREEMSLKNNIMMNKSGPRTEP